jgi:hypothetical protein
MKKGQGNGAVLYVRISTDEQANGSQNLSNEEQRCRDFCRREGLHVVALFGPRLTHPACREALRPARSIERDVRASRDKPVAITGGNLYTCGHP